MKLIKDLGMKFPTEKSKRKYRFGLYECTRCGTEMESIIQNVKSKNVNMCKSCARATHKETKTRLYRIWRHIKDRCHNKNCKHYESYGGRGIFMLTEWYNDYVLFRDWALSNGYSDELTIDRIDNDKGYYPSNCRWTNRLIQNTNQRVRKDNKTGYTGISKIGNKFRSEIQSNYLQKHIGMFETMEEAVCVRNAYILENNLHHKIQKVRDGIDNATIN